MNGLQSTWRIWRWPLLLALLSLLGLLAALLGDGAWNVVSWLCLGALPMVMVLAPLRRRH